MFVTSHKSCQTQVHLIYHILSYLTYPSSLPTVCILTLFSHFNLCVCEWVYLFTDSMESC